MTPATAFSADQVREQLGRILASPVFAPSRRMCRFLRFVVDRTLESDTDRLKEFSVAMEVFDRDDKYDPNIDSIVRVEARRLRLKLKAYYDGPGVQDRVLIELRPGNYVPEFVVREAIAEAVAVEERPADPADERSVAVLPFVNMSSDPEQEYFCDGITEEIINALTTIEGLNIVARTSVFQFKGKAADMREIGERLGARVLIEGSVRKSGGRLRITAQAIDSAKGYHLWSETFNRDMSDVFTIQDEISSAIAGILHVRLRPAAASKMRDVNAFSGYLRGRFLENQMSPEGVAAAVDQYRAVIARHPDYPEPRVALAVAMGYMALVGAVPGRVFEPEMRTQIDIAMRLDPASPAARACMACIVSLFDHEWARGEQLFREVLALQPGQVDARSWFGMVLAHQGRFEEALNELQLVARLDPLSAADYSRLAMVYYMMGDLEQAKQNVESAFSLIPGFHHARVAQALVLVNEGDYARAEGTLRHSVGTSPPVILGLLAAVYFRWGKIAEGEACVAQLRDAQAHRYITPLAFAYVHVARGEFDQAIEAIDQTITDKHVFVSFLGVDPYFDPIRKHPRFQSLMDRLRLPSIR